MIKDILSKTKSAGKKVLADKDNKELVIDSTLAFIIRVIAAFASFIMNVVVARYLGINASGIFFLAFGIVTIISTIVRFGTDNVVLRFVGIYSHEEKWNLVRGIVYFSSFIVLVISVLTTVPILFFTKDICILLFKKVELEGSLFWISISIPCIAISTIISMALQGIKRVFYSVCLQSVFIPFFLIIFTLFIKPVDATQMSILYFVASFLTLVISIILWFIYFPNGKFNYNSKMIYADCYPLWIVAILQQVIQWGGQFIAGIYCEPKILAELAVAQRTSILISFILVAINMVSAPKFANYYKQGKMEQLRQYSKNTTRLMILFATPMLLIVFFFPNFILSIFGKGFTDAKWMLIILSLGQYVSVISGLVGYLLMMSGHNKDYRNITIISGIVSLILNMVLVKFFGGIGAAVAISLAVATQNILAIGMVKKRLGFSTLQIF